MRGLTGVEDGRKTGISPVAALALATVALLISISTILGGRALGWVVFRDLDWANFGTRLLPFLLMAVLIERTVEVLFGITREPLAREEEARSAAMRRALAAAGDVRANADPGQEAARLERARSLVEHFGRTPAPHGTTGMDAGEVAARAAEELAVSERAQAEARARAGRAAFLLTLSLGLLAGTLGFRILSGVVVDVERSWPVVVLSGDAPAASAAAAATARTAPPDARPPVRASTPARRVYPFFVLLDILLTAGLLSGGADGINHITRVISGYLSGLRDQTERRNNSPHT